MFTTSGLPPAQDQLRRVERFLRRLENYNRNEEEYTDDLWAFFQNCWHLKDWLKADGSILRKDWAKFEEDLKTYEALMICADLANRTKHYRLSLKRRDAMVTDRVTRIRVGKEGFRVVSRTFAIELGDGSQQDAVMVAKQALEDWYTVFDLYGIKRGTA